MTTAKSAALAIGILLLMGGSAMSAVPSELLAQGWYRKAPPLPPPTGEVIRVKTVEQIRAALKDVKPGGTILIADGHYMMHHLEIGQPDVTLRSASGDRSKVILDGNRGPDKTYAGELVRIQADGITVADLTIQNAKWNGFKLYNLVDRARIHNCVIHNVWQRGVKQGLRPEVNGKRQYNHDNRVQYCLFYNDRPKRWGDDPDDDKGTTRFGGNYIGGMDVMAAKGWTVSDNVFVNIKGRTGSGRGAIFMWVGGEDCVVERNIIIDCDRGICIGNPSGRDTDRIRHATRFVVRNNFVTRCPGNAIEFDWTRDCKFYHNTVHSPTGRLLVAYAANDGLQVVNNILNGRPPSLVRTTGKITIRNNLNKIAAGRFRDAAKGDLHLTPHAVEAIDKAEPLEDVFYDVDRRPRGGKPDLGADEVLATGPPTHSLLEQPWYPKAPPLGPPTGGVIRVRTVEALFAAVKAVKPGGTVLIADGHYDLPRYLGINTSNVTVRSESGKRDKVVLDAGKARLSEAVGTARTTGVTIADLTIQNAWRVGFKIHSNTGVHKLKIHNCVFHNIWQRPIKGVPGVFKDGKHIPSSDCTIQYCLFYTDHRKRFEDDPFETAHPEMFGGDYIAGMDIMNARNYVIRGNVFVGIGGFTGQARGAIFMWNVCEDCLIERNVIIDCDTGICLGNSHRTPEKWPIHCTRFLVRNNFITRAPECCILADYTKDCKILHNTVHDPTQPLSRLIRVVHDNDGLLVANNLFSGPGIQVEQTTGKVTLRNNVRRQAAEYFVDPHRGNLHLTAKAAEAIDKAEPTPEVPEDIDGKPRAGKPDVGADELDQRD
jgi:hypothetical protein